MTRPERNTWAGNTPGYRSTRRTGNAAFANDNDSEKMALFPAWNVEKRHAFGPGEILSGLCEFETRLRNLWARPLAGWRPRQFAPRRHAHRPNHSGVTPLGAFDEFRMRAINCLAIPRHAPGFVREEFERRLVLELHPDSRDDSADATEVNAMDAEDVPALRQARRNAVALDAMPTNAAAPTSLPTSEPCT